MIVCGSSDMGDRCRKGLVALNGKRHAKRIRGKGLGDWGLGIGEGLV